MERIALAFILLSLAACSNFQNKPLEQLTLNADTVQWIGQGEAISRCGATDTVGFSLQLSRSGEWSSQVTLRNTDKDHRPQWSNTLKVVFHTPGVGQSKAFTLVDEIMPGGTKETYTPSGTLKAAAEKFDGLINSKVTLIHECKGLKKPD